jgi:hypothetical protein
MRQPRLNPRGFRLGLHKRRVVHSQPVSTSVPAKFTQSLFGDRINR